MGGYQISAEIPADDAGDGRDAAMSQPMTLLAHGAAALGVVLSPAQLEQFRLYGRELADWNRRHGAPEGSGS